MTMITFIVAYPHSFVPFNTVDEAVTQAKRLAAQHEGALVVYELREVKRIENAPIPLPPKRFG
jgi:hypothetical protein